MEKVTFFESIFKILNMSSTMQYFFETLLLTIFLLVLMILFYFRKSKISVILCIILYFITLILLPISHFSFLIDTIDNIIGNFISVIYFPSIYVYIFMILVTDLFTFKKLVKREDKKWYDLFSFIYFFIFQFLFFLAVRLIISYDIDIFQKTSIYSNASLTSVLQVSSYIFWISIVIKLISFFAKRLNQIFISNKKAAYKNTNIDFNHQNTNNILNDVVTDIKASTNENDDEIEILDLFD